MSRFNTGCLVALGVALLSVGPANARQLSPDEALRLVPSSFVDASTRSNPDPLYTQTAGDLNVAFLFPYAGGEGYLVVGADDLLPPVLGYSDTGRFEAASIPPAMEMWLGEYGRQLAYFTGKGYTPERVAESDLRAEIAPLCSSLWNQSEPFNDNCPSIDGEKAPTGCTATAMAQVLYTHKWPKRGTGSNTYLSGSYRQKLTFDFGATEFDWDNMLPSYNGRYTEEQGAAVATLMEACGNAALMSYGADASGAYPYDAIYGMVKFMGYDKSAMKLDRDYYTSAVWTDMVYSELAAGRPVIYGGYNSSYQDGHTFVVDGYSRDGFFHVNWGWGGMSNGYFLLTALDPSEQGIGGSASGYSFKQDAIFNVMPAREDSQYHLEVMWDGPVVTGSKAYTSNSFAAFGVGGEGIYSAFTLQDAKVTMGVRLTPTTGGEAVFYPGSEVDFPAHYGQAQYAAYTSFYVAVSSLPKSGAYVATPAYEYNGTVYDVAVKVGEAKSVYMVCSKMGVKFEEVEVERTLTADNIKVSNTLYSGKSCTLTADIRNSGEEYLGLVRAGFVDGEGTVLSWLPGVPVNLVDGGVVNVTFSGTLNSYSAPLAPGEYFVNIYDEAGDIISPEPLAVTVVEAPSGKPVFDVVFTVNETGDGTKMSPYLIGDHMDMSVTVNVTSGLFDEVIALYAYYEDQFVGDYYKSAEFTSSTQPYKNFFVGPGDTQTLTYNLGTSDFDRDQTVFIEAYSWKSDWSGEASGWIGRKVYVKRTLGSVDGIAADEGGLYPNPAYGSTTVTAGAAISSIRIYSLSGAEVIDMVPAAAESSVEVDLGGLTPGHYIVVVTTAKGIERHRLIKR